MDYFTIKLSLSLYSIFPPSNQNKRDAALRNACRFGYQRTVQALLRNGADMNKANINKESPLYLACHNGHLDIVSLLMHQGCDANEGVRVDWHRIWLSATEYCRSMLHVAIAKNHLALARLLIEQGASLTTPDSRGWSPLALACEKSGVEMVTLLLDHGATDEHHLALRAACRRRNAAIVKLLMERLGPAPATVDIGEDVVDIGGFVERNSGSTLLHEYCSGCSGNFHRAAMRDADASLELLEYLLQQGAEANALATSETRPERHTPLQLLLMAHQSWKVQTHVKLRAVRMLVQYAGTVSGTSALQEFLGSVRGIMCEPGCTAEDDVQICEQLDALIAQGAPVNDEEDDSLLFQRGEMSEKVLRKRLVRRVLRHVASPLHLACARESDRVAEHMMIRHGAAVDAMLLCAAAARQPVVWRQPPVHSPLVAMKVTVNLQKLLGAVARGSSRPGSNNSSSESRVPIVGGRKGREERGPFDHRRMWSLLGSATVEASTATREPPPTPVALDDVMLSESGSKGTTTSSNSISSSSSSSSSNNNNNTEATSSLPNVSVRLNNDEVGGRLGIRVDINGRGTAVGDTALHVAVRCCLLPNVALLLQWGANPNIENFDGFTPLYVSCMEYGGDYESDGHAITRLLLQHRCDGDDKYVDQ